MRFQFFEVCAITLLCCYPSDSDRLVSGSNRSPDSSQLQNNGRREGYQTLYQCAKRRHLLIEIVTGNPGNRGNQRRNENRRDQSENASPPNEVLSSCRLL